LTKKHVLQYDGKKAVLLSAATSEEKLQWMEDIAEAVQVSVLEYKKTTKP